MEQITSGWCTAKAATSTTIFHDNFTSIHAETEIKFA